MPFAMGASLAVGGNVVKDAFGVVAMVAMTPLIAIQILGLVYKLKQSKATKVEEPVEFVEEQTTIDFGVLSAQSGNAEVQDDDIIDF